MRRRPTSRIVELEGRTPTPPTPRRSGGRGSLVAAAALVLLAGCGRDPRCDRCDTLVIAATGEPTTLNPPLVAETVGRDISDLIFEHLASLPPGGSPTDPASFEPALAIRWEAVDSSTWRFVLRPGARWHDGRPVTAHDVRFSFEAFTDTALGAPAGPALADLAGIETEGDSALRLRFRTPRSDAFYDAVWSVRILPRHVWDPLQRSDWPADTAIARLVGSGPFRITDWRRGQSLTLERAATDSAAGAIRRVVWRFTGDQDAALNLVLAHEADLIETVTSPGGLARARADTALATIRYPSAVYGFAGFQHRTPAGRPHPLLSNRTIRRVLTMALDRQSLVHAVIGPDAVVPPGPLSRALWIWNDSIAMLPYDSAAANRLLDSLGWRPAADGIRRRGGRRLAVDILVPGTSQARKNLAQGMQEMWRAVGVGATITPVDFPVFQERLGRGRFEVMIGAWLDEPNPRALAEQWTRAGWGTLNYGRYDNPTIDSLLGAALGAADRSRARLLWHQALDSLNADAPGIFLYNPTNTAVAARRLEGVRIDPFSWLAALPTWRVREP